MRRCEGLVQVHVNDVEAHVGRPHSADNRVEIRAVVVEQASGFVHSARDLDNALLEQAAGGRIGEHEPCGSLRERCLERFLVDVAGCCERYFAHLEAAHGGRCRIGAVRRFWHENLVTLGLPFAQEVGAHNGESRELALRACHRRQRHRRHAGESLQMRFKLHAHLQEALVKLVWRKWMASKEAGVERDFMRRPRVVFHGARSKRVEARVDREVLLRDARVVANSGEFSDLRQIRRGGAQERFGNVQLMIARTRLRRGLARALALVIDSSRHAPSTSRRAWR